MYIHQRRQDKQMNASSCSKIQFGFHVKLENLISCKICTGLFKKKYKLLKNYFKRTADAKLMSCVRMERKSLKVLISMI
jgi:hypothetical protein